jgi:predicted HTH transcriptional regulator
MEMCVFVQKSIKDEAPGENQVRSWSKEPFHRYQLSYECYENSYTSTEAGSLLFSKNKVYFFSATREFLVLSARDLNLIDVVLRYPFPTLRSWCHV